MKAADIRRIFAKPARLTNPNARRNLTPSERTKVRSKTKGTCHVCGGKLGRDWQADHVVPYQLGGDHSVENYLPICRECNRLRWSYSPKVLRLIMRIGVYAKHEIRHDTKLGSMLVDCAAKRIDQTWRRRRLP
jgi:5-methylcytosine-specific restriction endonuclease McrA